jgi:hypothetical protein
MNALSGCDQHSSRMADPEPIGGPNPVSPAIHRHHPVAGRSVHAASHDDPLADEASVTAMLGAAYAGRRPVP